jgi:hypothetical protein
MLISELPACPVASKMRDDARKLASALIDKSRIELNKPLLLEVEREWHKARIARLS